MARRAVGVDERQLRHASAGKQVGGSQQAQCLGALLRIVGGATETGHRLTNLTAGYVPATGLDKLIGLRQG
jgi:hypothetical protein